MTVMPCCVNDGRNNDGLFTLQHLIDYSVREILRIAPSNTLGGVFSASEKRVLGESLEHLQYLVYESAAKSLFVGVVPIGRLSEILLNLWTDDDAPTHLLERRRTRFLNPSKDKEEEG